MMIPRALITGELIAALAVVAEPIEASGRRSTFRRRCSLYNPHDGGGERPVEMTADDRERLMAAAAKRERRALRLAK